MQCEFRFIQSSRRMPHYKPTYRATKFLSGEVFRCGRSAQQYGGFGDKPSGEGVGGLPEPGVAGAGELAAPY